MSAGAPADAARISERLTDVLTAFQTCGKASSSASYLFLHIRIYVYCCIYIAHPSEDTVVPPVVTKHRRKDGNVPPLHFDKVISHD